MRLYSTPELIQLFEGSSLGEDLEEYKDAEEFLRIEGELENGNNLGILDTIKFERIKKKYGLVEVYNI